MDNNPLKILLVEDNPGDARLIEEMLRESGSIQFELIHRGRLDEAMKCLAEVSFDILLVDLNLPNSQGLETVTRIISAAPGLPIIVLTGLKDEMIGIQAVQKGTQDYLVKGQIDNRILARTITYAIQRKKVEEELRRAQEELEQRVKERTEELTIVNEQLVQEIQERKRAEETIRLNESRLEALLELNEMKTSSMDDIADFVLEEGIKLTKSKIGFIGFMKDNESVMDLHSWSKSAMEECSIADRPIQYRIERAGLYGEAIRQKKPIIVNDYLAPNAHKKGYPEGHVKLLRLVVLPVIDDDRVVTVIAVGNKDNEYDELDLRQLKLLMDGMWEIIKRKRAKEALQESEKQLKHLSSQLLTFQEKERKRIAQELHDSVGQMLSALKYSVESTLNQMSKRIPRESAQSLDLLIPKIQSTVEEVEKIGMGLRPSILDDIGIIATLSWFCREFEIVYSNIHIEQEITLEEDEVPEPLKVVMYRILQESLNNIAKHSRANYVHISLNKKDRTIELAIRDNGRGFDLKRTLSPDRYKNGVGLISMIKRAELSGGSLVIKSDKKAGTTIQALWQC